MAAIPTAPKGTLLIVGVKGLGKEVALHFARAHWRVICAARTRDVTDALALEVNGAGGEGVSFPCDVTDPKSLVGLASHAIDLAVCAQSPGGRFGAKPLLELDDAELARSLDVMLRGTWNVLKAVGPGMVARKTGTFIQCGTSSGVRTREGFAGLGAVQAGLRALVQVAAKEWRPAGVHVAYLVIDGPIDSAAIRPHVPEERLLDPRELARACEYLHAQSPRAWTHELLLRTAASDWTTPT